MTGGRSPISEVKQSRVDTGKDMTRQVHHQHENTAANAAAPVCVGRFGYRPGSQTMWWSRQSTALHGVHAPVDPADGQMSVASLLARTRPCDRGPLAEALAGGGGFCLRVRLPDGAGTERTLILLADPTNDDSDRPDTEIEGIYLDLTPTLHARTKALVDEALPRMVAAGAAVEQAVGMLRLVYAIPAAKAREILAWRAEETGVPVSDFAARLCAAVTGDGLAAPTPVRSRVDDLLLRAHDRIDAG
ncbi:ANTAR domain-containing protein [Nocardia sp. NPDC057227]|uniref:ANTAR domain-containing protein n=1 Tax=Nocardia sp. NPDC057227 TaxID=3346056 RepID=UPI0036349698